MSETLDVSQSPSGLPATSLGGGRKWWALAACCFGLFMSLLDVSPRFAGMASGVNNVLPAGRHSFWDRLLGGDTYEPLQPLRPG